MSKGKNGLTYTTRDALAVLEAEHPASSLAAYLAAHGACRRWLAFVKTENEPSRLGDARCSLNNWRGSIEFQQRRLAALQRPEVSGLAVPHDFEIDETTTDAGRARAFHFDVIERRGRPERDTPSGVAIAILHQAPDNRSFRVYRDEQPVGYASTWRDAIQWARQLAAV
jgi:hypothetical protein